ncbi:MAG: GNAT family N-acetyltransferase [Candidatus Hydrogenedentes bacterium]|nr:GNAT family N-acetyltransferase [Candidatus Hydrogenedentota bacterium]
MLLETRQLQIRFLCEEDVPALVALWTDPDVTRFMGGPREAETLRAGLTKDAQWAEDAPLSLLPIVEVASGAVVGHCGLIPKEVDGQNETELIYVLARAVWGKGYATEAAAAVMEHAFGALGLVRLVALIDPANVASARVAEKICMRHEGDTVRPSGKVLRVYAGDARHRDRALQGK